MSKSAYAKHRGVSRQTVYDWIEKGEVVVIDGKIDVEATDKKRNNAQGIHPWHDPDKKINISPRAAMYSVTSDFSDEKYVPLAVSAQDAANMVLTLDDIYPPAETEEELIERVQDAAESLGLEIRTIGIDENEEGMIGIELYDPSEDVTVMRFDSFLFELEALTFMRWLIINKSFCDDDLKNVTKAGLAALAEPFVVSVKDVYVDRFEPCSDEA